MYTIRKSIKSVLRHTTHFKGFFQKWAKNAVSIPKQVKIGTVILVDHNKVDEVSLIDQRAVNTVTLVDQYKIGDVEFVC